MPYKPYSKKTSVSEIEIFPIETDFVIEMIVDNKKFRKFSENKIESIFFQSRNVGLSKLETVGVILEIMTNALNKNKSR